MHLRVFGKLLDLQAFGHKMNFLRNCIFDLVMVLDKVLMDHKVISEYLEGVHEFLY